MTNLRSNPAAVSELRQAQQLIHKLDRLRNDQNRSKKVGYGPRTRITSTDIRRRELNTKIIYHLHQAKVLNEQETLP